MTHPLVGEAWLHSRHKRAMDIAVIGLTAPMSIPLGLAAVTCLAIESQRSSVFVQERVGKLPGTINIPKLRTLHGDIDHANSAYGHNHERATRLGRLIRKTHIDELPQIGLVASGHMSVVGPRPIVPYDYENIMDTLSAQEQAEWILARTICTPGLMGLEAANQHFPSYQYDPRERVESDIEYAHTASLKVDIHVILRTLSAVQDDVSRTVVNL